MASLITAFICTFMRISTRSQPHRTSTLISTYRTGDAASSELSHPRHTNRKRATIVNMLMALLAMRLLEVMFFVGLVGSAVVVLISFIEDGKELFGKDEVNE